TVADLAFCPTRFAPQEPTPGRVQCGVAQTCALSDGCCDGPLATDVPECGLQSFCHGPQLRCDGPEDCPQGQACCALLGLVRQQDRIECANGCDFPFCHSDADCPAGRVCYFDYQYFRGTVGSCGPPC